MIKFSQIIDNQEIELFVDNENLDGRLGIQLRSKIGLYFIENCVIILDPNQVKELRDFLNKTTGG